MSDPLVSIVLCCHNRRNYLEQTLASVFAQRHPAVEIIVMDDGSTDGTPELMERYASRLRYYRQEPQGIAVARTHASRLAHGEYIAYQDDDDLMPPDRIVSLLGALRRFPEAAFATGDFALIDASGKLTGRRWMPAAMEVREPPVLLPDGQRAVLWPEVPAVPHTTLFRRELGERVGWFDPEFRYACSDADFLARLGELGPVTYVREVVSYYRRGHSALWADDLRTSCSRVQLWEKHLQRTAGTKPDLHARLRERLLAVVVRLEQYRQSSNGAAEGGEFDLDNYIARALDELSAAQRLDFRFQTRIKFPLRRLVKGVPR